MTQLKPLTFQPFQGLTDQAEVETVAGRPAGKLLRSPMRHGHHFIATAANGNEIYSGVRIAMALENLAIFAPKA